MIRDQSDRVARLLPLALLVVLVLPLVCWLYWPGAGGPLMFDDYASLVPVSLEMSAGDSWRELVFGDRSGPLGRPLSMLTFVVEQRVLGIPLEAAKVTNILLHAINGLLVFCLLRLVLGPDAAGGAMWIAPFATTLWLVAPIHVSTVLYLVQRMAMLAAFFVLLALVLYAWGRRLQIRGIAGWWLPCLLAPLALAVGLFTKENAVVGFPALLLLELLVFRLRGFSHVVTERARVFCILFTAAGLAAAVVLLALNWSIVEKSYALRPFSLPERLLTQLRVLWDYVAQTVTPDVSRMGIHHDDFPLSRSLFRPVSTLVSALAWSCLLGVLGVMLYFRRGYIVALGALFFLLTHALESSVIPLELYYEHRNYLPSIGIFLSVAAVAAWALQRVEGMAVPIGLMTLVYFGFLLFSTSSQVRVWSSPSLLAINTVQAHPESPRANTDMAVHLARNGAYRLALDYSKAAHEVSSDERWLDYRLRDAVLACYASAAVPAISAADIPGDERQRPAADVHTLSVLVEMVSKERCERRDVEALADSLASIFMHAVPTPSASALFYSRLASLENALARYGNALWYAERYRELAPGSVTAMLMLLHFNAVLERTTQTEALRARLWELQQRGKLSASQEETLTLYGPAGSPNR